MIEHSKQNRWSNHSQSEVTIESSYDGPMSKIAAPLTAHYRNAGVDPLLNCSLLIG
jgi:hypothetical protein